MVLHESQISYHKEIPCELSRVCQLRKRNTETKAVYKIICSPPLSMCASTAVATADWTHNNLLSLYLAL